MQFAKYRFCETLRRYSGLLLRLAVAAVALSVCVDVAASLLPTVAAAASSTFPTLRSHNMSAAAVQLMHAGGGARSWRTTALVHVCE